MGFFKGMKDKLGIGGVSIDIQAPGQFTKGDNIEGKLVLTTKSDQEIIEIVIKVYEEFTSGRGEEKSTSEFDLGVLKLDNHFLISTGDQKEIQFSIPVNMSKSELTDMSEQSGVMGAIGKMGKFAASEKSSYFLQANVDVKSAVLDPTEKKEIRIV